MWREIFKTNGVQHGKSSQSLCATGGCSRIFQENRYELEQAFILTSALAEAQWSQKRKRVLTSPVGWSFSLKLCFFWMSPLLAGMSTQLKRRWKMFNPRISRTGSRKTPSTSRLLIVHNLFVRINGLLTAIQYWWGFSSFGNVIFVSFFCLLFLPRNWTEWIRFLYHCCFKWPLIADQYWLRTWSLLSQLGMGLLTENGLISMGSGRKVYETIVLLNKLFEPCPPVRMRGLGTVSESPAPGKRHGVKDVIKKYGTYYRRQGPRTDYRRLHVSKRQAVELARPDPPLEDTR